jgi:hypothetical protein
MSHDLEALKQHRDALLLAEAAAWLHDWQKVISFWKQLGGTVSPSAVANVLASLYPPDPLSSSVNSSVKDMIEQGRDPSRARHSPDWRIRLIGICHDIAHVDKPEEKGLGSSCSELATVFGYESLPKPSFHQLEQAVHFLVGGLQRQKFLYHLRESVANAVGDTRRPINEVTLWSWGASTAAFWKAAAARFVLEGRVSESDLRWRTLRVAVDGLAFYGQAARLPDLLVRRDLLRDALDRVQTLLEETYPLGNEVYRDETGSLYVVPNLARLCDLTDAAGTRLETLILREFARGTVRNKPLLALSGEIGPAVELDSQAWWGQRPDFKNQPPSMDETPPVGRILQQDVSTHADAEAVAGWWTGSTHDICPVCGLRPQADPKSQNKDERKAGERKVCLICEQRRASRAQEWARNLSTTIWTDEVADAHGRLALIVGRFDLSRWLDGVLVQTLTVTDPAQDSTPDKSKVVKKNPSFARLRRGWETTRAFWQEVLPTGQGRDGTRPLVGEVVGQSGPRLAIIPAERDNLDLGLFHTYELVVNSIRLSVVWDSDNRRFITCDNLDYLARPEQLGREVAQVVQPGRTFALEEPAGYGGANRKLGTVTVERVEPLAESYAPAIPILAEPRTFMALVPADKALEVVKAIKAKYEREMGKVRNRLPLTLGVVYAGRRTPLAALLDAGRQMLRRSVQEVRAEVKTATPPIVTDAAWPAMREVTLSVGERQIVVTVPTVMGDGKTPDVWYPYWQAAGKPAARTRWFVGADGEHWVHVCDLRAGDAVAFTPSTFDFEYLDTTARRFEVAYGPDGRRRGKEKRQRPYLLEEIDAIEQAWGEIRRLSGSQIRQVEALIEAKRRDWGEPTGALAVSPTFKRFVGDVLREARVHTHALEQAAITGMLADALELHLTIAK